MLITKCHFLQDIKEVTTDCEVDTNWLLWEPHANEHFGNLFSDDHQHVMGNSTPQIPNRHMRQMFKAPEKVRQRASVAYFATVPNFKPHSSCLMCFLSPWMLWKLYNCSFTFSVFISIISNRSRWCFSVCLYLYLTNMLVNGYYSPMTISITYSIPDLWTQGWDLIS